MPLVEFAFTAGLDQGTDPRRTVKLTALSNYVWTKRGMIEKRPGYGVLSTAIVGNAYSRVATVTVTATGGGYSAGIWFATGGGGAGASGFYNTSGGAVIAATISLVNPGYGYTSPPTLVFPGGSGATGTTTLTAPTGAGGSLAETYTIATNPHGELETTDGSSIYRLIAQGWEPLGPLASRVGISLSPLPIIGSSAAFSPSSLQAINWDVAYANGYQVFGYNVFGYNGILALDAETGAVLAGPPGGTASLGNYPVAVTDGRWVWMFFTNPSTFNMQFFACDTATTPPTIGTAPATFETSSTIPAIVAFDARWWSSGGRLAILYQVHSASNVTFDTYTYDNSGLYGQFVQVSSFNAGTVSGATMCAVCTGASGDIYYAYSYVQSGNVFVYACRVDLHASSGNVEVYTAATTVTTSITNLTIVETNVAGTEYHVAFTAIDANDVDQVQSFKVSIDFSLTQSVVAGTVTCGLTLASRAYSPASNAHALTYSLAAQGYFVSDITGTDPGLSGKQAVPLASINPRTAFATPASMHADLRYPGSLVSMQPVGADWMVPVTIASDPGVTQALNLQQATITYGATPSPPAVEWTSTLYPAGVPTIVGVEQVFEANFLAPPVILSVTPTLGSGAIAPGEYAYVACFERVADDGSIVRSPPSNAVTVNLASAGTTIAISTTTYSIGKANVAIEDINGAFIVLYRTATNGTTFTRVAGDPYNFGSSNGAASNNPLVSAVTITDNASSAAVSAHVALYTEGGVFENVCPPACSIAARVRDRVYLAGTPDGFTVYYSDSIQSTGTTNFHDEQTIVVDDGGPVTGIGAIDSNTLIFKAGAIYVVYGTEGTNAGVGNTLSNPTLVPSGGIGCISANSIVSVPEGLMFQSARGLELLDRNLTVTFAGDPVKDATSGQTVVSAIVVPAQYQVRFFLASGGAVVYSLFTGEWSTFAYPVATGTNAATLDGSGLVTWCSAGATIQQETPGAYSDNGAWITSAWAGGWLTLGEGLQGYRRYEAFELLGTWGGECGFTLTVAADYSATPSQTEVRTSTQIQAIPGFDSNRVQFEVRPVVAKAEAVQVTFTDAPPVDATLTKGIAWESLTFEVFAKQGRYRGLASAAKG